MASVASAEEKRVDLVFEGGGVKGIGLAGAFSYLDEQGYKAQRVAGTSAGAITAALVAAGYRRDELQAMVLNEMRFEKFEDGHRSPIGGGLELLAHNGMHPGNYFEGWMRERLAAKGVTTFGQLRQPDAGEGEPQHRLQVIASDVTRERMLVLPQDAREHLGTDADELEVAKAVRMSMSIPVFFEPVVYSNPADRGDEHVIVDGGILSNFPIWLFDCPAGQTPRWPTFGLLLVAPNQADPLIPSPGPPTAAARKLSRLDYLRAIANTMMEAHDRLYVEQANYARTIPIDTLGVKTTQFTIDQEPELKQRLYQSGRVAAETFLKTWDFGAYINAFRIGEQPTRREHVAEVLARNKQEVGPS